MWKPAFEWGDVATVAGGDLIAGGLKVLLEEVDITVEPDAVGAGDDGDVEGHLEFSGSGRASGFVKRRDVRGGGGLFFAKCSLRQRILPAWRVGLFREGRR